MTGYQIRLVFAANRIVLPFVQMSWADAIANNMLWVQGFGLAVSAVTLGVLVWYALETLKLRVSAQEQVKVSQKLLSAAEDQAEGTSKPCITIRAELRDPTDTLLHSDGAVGGSVAKDASGHYVAVNIGNGPALNVSYFFSARFNRARFCQSTRRCHSDEGYVPPKWLNQYMPAR
jgi:hypothetical protein